MTKLGPTREEIEASRAAAPDGPVAIVNLLRFKPGVGRAGYARYLAGAAGAAHPDCTVLHAGPAFHDCGTGEDWDYVILARYPRFADFADTVAHEAWQVDGARHRPDALERTLMIVSPAGDLRADFGASRWRTIASCCAR